MTDRPAGWYEDPTGEAAHRYWDGAGWTGHVSGGSSLGIPGIAAGAPAAPGSPTQPAAGATAVAVAGGGDSPFWQWLDGIGPAARTRPQPLLRLAVAGIGGLVVAYGVFALIGEGTDGRAGAAIAGAIVTIAAFAVRLKVSRDAFRAAAVGAGIAGIIVLVGAAVPPETQDDFGVFFLLTSAVLALAWALPGFRGSSLMLGIAALGLVFGAGSLVSGDELSQSDCEDIFVSGDDVPTECFGEGSSSELVDSDPTGVLTDTSIVYFVFGAAYMGAVALLDRRGFHGVATSFVAAGVLSTVIGLTIATVELLFRDPGGATGAAALAILTGLVVCLVGSSGNAERRATTWWGAAILSIGTVGFLVAAVKPDSDSTVGVLMLAAGCVLIFGPRLVRTIRDSNREQRAGDGSPGPGGGPGSAGPWQPPLR